MVSARRRHFTAAQQGSGLLELEVGWEAGKSTGSAELELPKNLAEERSHRQVDGDRREGAIGFRLLNCAALWRRPHWLPLNGARGS